VLVPETVTLVRLHTILQAAMGWTDSHLHQYEIANKRYGIEDPDWPSSVPIFDERRARLKSFIEDHVKDFTYLYDFGDGWEHRVTIEELVASQVSRRRNRLRSGHVIQPDHTREPLSQAWQRRAVIRQYLIRHRDVLIRCK
jgi:hypothetical protein